MFTRAALRSAETEFYSSCTYLLDCHLVVMTHSCLPPSHLAAAAVLAALTLYKAAVKDCPASPALSTIWTPTLVYYTSYKAGDILLTALELLNQLESQASGKLYIQLRLIANSWPYYLLVQLGVSSTEPTSSTEAVVNIIGWL